MAVVDVEAVRRENDRAFLEVVANAFAVNFPLDFVREGDDDDVGLFDGFGDARNRFETGFFRETIVVGTFALANDDVAAAVAEVLRVRVPLRTVTDNRDRHILQDGKIGVVFIINRSSHLR